jgi:hypothetical protein
MKKMEPDPNCCEVWPLIAAALQWFVFEDQPEMATTPYMTGTDGQRYFVNHCPSCGANARNRQMLAKDVRTQSANPDPEIEKLVEDAYKAVKKANKVLDKS